MHVLLKAVSCMPVGIQVTHVQLRRKGPCLLPGCCCLTLIIFLKFFKFYFVTIAFQQVWSERRVHSLMALYFHLLQKIKGKEQC